MNRRMVARLRPVTALVVLVLGAALSLAEGAFANVGNDPDTFLSAGAPAPDSEDRFDAVPEFSFTAETGEALTRDDLLGAPWIAVPFFLRCTGPCPSVTRDIRERLHDQLDGTPIRIVSFSVDPTIDTAEELRDYAESIDADPARWSFVTAEDEGAMHAFLNGGLKMPVQRAEDAADPGQAIVHSTRMAVIDAEGKIAGWYELLDPGQGDDALPPEEAEPIVDARYALLTARARHLAGLDFVWPLRTPSRIPLINASLNGTALLLLILGMVAIKAGKKGAHEHLMKLAFVVSATFLGFYLYYHFAVLPISGGPTKYNGEGAAKTAYLLMLLTHVVLAVVNLPMVLRVLWLAHKEDWERHRRLAKWTFPIWAYVSLTGVLVYLVLYPFNPPV